MNTGEDRSGTGAGAERPELSCPVPLPPGDRIQLGHGGGGRLTAALIRDHLLPAFGDPELARLADAATLEVPGGRLAFTTDAFVVQPIVFPGGDIGSLAVYGTVNDLAMMGARPLALAVALILEEGLELGTFDRVVASMATAARRAGVRLVAGDTKVVERGAADGCYVTTTGIGVVPPGVEVGPERGRPGDAVLCSGPIGVHGVAVMSRRAGIGFDTDLHSDAAPLHDLVAAGLAAGGVHALRDPTRGGLAAACNELAQASGVSIVLREDALDVPGPVAAACEMLGLDPLHVAGEGICVALVAPEDADRVLAAWRAHPSGRRAARIGEVRAGPPAVWLRTGLGVHRPVQVPTGEALPRIC